MNDIDFANDLTLLSNTIENAEELLHHIELAAREVGLHIDAKKTEYMSINYAGIMKSLDDQMISEVLNFVYLGSEIQSPEKEMTTRIEKAWHR